jgi:hypothetical protein
MEREQNEKWEPGRDGSDRRAGRASVGDEAQRGRDRLSPWLDQGNCSCRQDDRRASRIRQHYHGHGGSSQLTVGGRCPAPAVDKGHERCQRCAVRDCRHYHGAWAAAVGCLPRYHLSHLFLLSFCRGQDRLGSRPFVSSGGNVLPRTRSSG